MNTYVALLRGINVGGTGKVDMTILKSLFEQMGYQNVRTYINSGNVLFEAADDDQKKLKDAIQAGISAYFGITIAVILRDKANIAQLCAAFPQKWSNDDDQKTDILFLGEEFDSADTIGLIKHDPAVDTLIYIHGAIGWNIRRIHAKQSGLYKFIGTPVYKAMTARNINTVRKLNDLLQQTR